MAIVDSIEPVPDGGVGIYGRCTHAGEVYPIFGVGDTVEAALDDLALAEQELHEMLCDVPAPLHVRTMLHDH